MTLLKWDTRSQEIEGYLLSVLRPTNKHSVVPNSYRGIAFLTSSHLDNL